MTPRIEEYLAYLGGVRNLSGATTEAYRADLAAYEGFLGGRDPLSVSHRDVRNFAASLALSGRAAVSVNRALSAVRGFYRWAQKFGHASADPSAQVRGLKAPRNLPEYLFEDEAALMLAMPEGEGLGPARDRALLEFLYSTGCRLAETAGLKDAALDLPRAKARVMGKGSKERLVFLNDHAVSSLAAYLALRDARFPASRGGAVFVNLRGGGLSRRGIELVVSRYAALAPSRKNVTPHSFRHSLATHLVDRGADIRVVQEILGHSSVSTTQVYTHVSLERLRAVYDRAHPHGRANGERR